MTFYEALGAMLGRALEVLSDGGADGRDKPTPHQLNRVIVFLRRMNIIWPEVFSCLTQENAVLRSGLRDLTASVSNQGITPPSNWLATDIDDPITQYRRLLGIVDDAMTFLHQHRSEPWGADSLRLLRATLADSLRVQGRIVDLALSVPTATAQ